MNILGMVQEKREKENPRRRVRNARAQFYVRWSTNTMMAGLYRQIRSKVVLARLGNTTRDQITAAGNFIADSRKKGVGGCRGLYSALLYPYVYRIIYE